MDTLALILSIIGAINWGLVGICQFDLVAWLFGGQTGIVSRIIYTRVGLAGLCAMTRKIHNWGAAIHRSTPNVLLPDPPAQFTRTTQV